MGRAHSYSHSRAHSPTFPALHLRHHSFSNPSVAFSTSQLILQPFHCFTYVTVHSPTPQALHLIQLASQLHDDKNINVPNGHVALQGNTQIVNQRAGHINSTKNICALRCEYVKTRCYGNTWIAISSQSVRGRGMAPVCPPGDSQVTGTQTRPCGELIICTFGLY